MRVCVRGEREREREIESICENEWGVFVCESPLSLSLTHFERESALEPLYTKPSYGQPPIHHSFFLSLSLSLSLSVCVCVCVW